MTILIAGDSFAADWKKSKSNFIGWPNLLNKNFDVVNVAQAGVSEFKILKQIREAIADKKFDTVIVAHTSPYRIPTECHPVHFNDPFYGNADLIFSDIEYHRFKFKNLLDTSIKSAYNFFQYHYDKDFWESTYVLMRNEINKLIDTDTKYLVIASPLVDSAFNIEKNVVEIDKIDLMIGNSNHLSPQGNTKIYNEIFKFL